LGNGHGGVIVTESAWPSAQNPNRGRIVRSVS
jgi:hypothetical protein